MMTAGRGCASCGVDRISVIVQKKTSLDNVLCFFVAGLQLDITPGIEHELLTAERIRSFS